jgi:AraC-like DNA-binding protein
LELLRTIPVAPDEWFSLLGSGGSIEPDMFGVTATPKPYGKPWRTIPLHVFYFVTQNAMEFRAEGEDVLLEKGTFMWIMPGVTHETRMPEGGQPFMNYYLRLKLTDPARPHPLRLEQNWILEKDAWAVLPHFQHVLDELKMPHAHHIVRVRAFLMAMTSWALGQANQPRQQFRVFTSRQRMRLAQYTEAHVGNGLTPNHLAEVLELSPAYFTRIFRHSFGVAPRQWILRRRIHAAAAMLSESDLPIKEISQRLGFCDLFLFSRQFKQVMGVAPRTYRENL